MNLPHEKPPTSDRLPADFPEVEQSASEVIIQPKKRAYSFSLLEHIFTQNVLRIMRLNEDRPTNLGKSTARLQARRRRVSSAYRRVETDELRAAQSLFRL
jgi:hypothetical protein